jgi:hypothetical protein
MKKIFLLLILSISLTFVTINECKTDVYFANGILTEEKDARSNALRVLSPAIEEDIYGTEVEMRKHIGKVDYAYNSTTESQWWDSVEALFQKQNWTLLLDIFGSHGEDLTLQVDKYEDSIKSGHKVLVVAHSQ